MMFNFLPLLTPPTGPAELTRMADAFRTAAWTDQIAHHLHRTWDLFRARLLSER
ncbi:hypothetical protein P3T35_006489 [Kitasatospora sp. GP30]|uniref:hypothetical protein n=1 Tax=Kitasatospora sp. GP30 TaxID=3035084 RepID=UPI0015D5EBF8|nr:hypothetical protein [Kitasatospora sp. GP30]MDH6144446.1 hypothetical protein [Kitasatospora sp. GP30]